MTPCLITLHRLFVARGECGPFEPLLERVGEVGMVGESGRDPERGWSAELALWCPKNLDDREADAEVPEELPDCAPGIRSGAGGLLL